MGVLNMQCGCRGLGLQVGNLPCSLLEIEMHDEIFQFEIFKNFIKSLKYFKTPF